MSKNARVKLLVCVLFLTVILVVTGGCKTKKHGVITPITEGPTTTGPEETKSTGLPVVDQESLLWSPATGLQKVYFDYNKFALRPDAMQTLTENADKIKKVLGPELNEYPIAPLGHPSTQVPQRMRSLFSMLPSCTIRLTLRLIG